MKGWRSKLIFMFILYFAGFATAIYLLGPPPKSEPGQEKLPNGIEKVFENFDSQEFVNSFNTGMHKCVDFGKDAAARTAKYIKEQVQKSEPSNPT